MTVSNQTARTGPYNGNGATTVFAYDFRILDQGHVVVTLKDAADVETVQTLTTDYTVSGVGAATGGNITMVVAPASGEQLTFSRSVPQTQEADFANRGGVQPEVLEAAYDKLTQLSQDKVELLGRVPRFPVSSALTDVELPLTLVANTALVVNAAGTGYTTGPTTSVIGAAQGYATAAAASETLASEWATLTSGIVASTDYSSKAWSVGGTGVTTTAGKGAAKEWSITTGAAVDTSEYSAKEYAIGTTVAVGSAKEWAAKAEDSAVAGGLFSSLHYSAKASDSADAAAASATSIGLTTRGDMLKRGASANERLAIGGANTVLLTDGTDPAWGQVSLAAGVTGTLPLANGGTGASDAAGARAALGLVIGTDVQAYDVDTLKADTTDVLTAGFAATPYNFGTKTSGTFTPDEANGNMQYGVNGGAYTLAPPTNNCTIVLQFTNDASAGSITTSGFTKVSGAFTTTNGHDFVCYITKINGFSELIIRALQ